MVLSVLPALFVLRVLGQVLVGVGGWLPSWEEWFSGLTWCSCRFCSSSGCIIVARRGSMHQWVSENKITP
jgi:hypothetical protein